jgi:3-methyladenine DNA glycosylase Mpg
MFMEPSTNYIYYSRGGYSLNFAATGDVKEVLMESRLAFTGRRSSKVSQSVMRELRPINGRIRSPKRLCSGQTLLRCSLGLQGAGLEPGPTKTKQACARGRRVLA